MPKRFYTQCFCLLTEGQMQIDDIASALQNDGFEIVKQVPAREGWYFGGPTVVIPFRPEVNGYVAADVVNEPWPDEMGDTESAPMLLGAWVTGHFGPFTFPGGLARAGQHSWTWQAGHTIAGRHGGFVRLRMSYVFGAERGDLRARPEDCDPLEELNFLSRCVLALLKLPGVICYFNPNGEVLRDQESFASTWQRAAEQRAIPLPLWVNVRFFRLNDEFFLMGTVGNGQLDAPDVEAIFTKESPTPADVDYYLRNVTHYLLDLDRDIKTGEAIDGPGDNDLSWIVEEVDQGAVDPPRPVIRLCPQDCQREIGNVLASVLRRTP